VNYPGCYTKDLRETFINFHIFVW